MELPHLNNLLRFGHLIFSQHEPIRGRRQSLFLKYMFIFRHTSMLKHHPLVRPRTCPPKWNSTQIRKENLPLLRSRLRLTALVGISNSRHCQECYKNSALLPNFFLTLITYGLLSYSVRLYYANIHTPLPFSFLSLRFSDHEDKASRFILPGRSRTTVL